MDRDHTLFKSSKLVVNCPETSSQRSYQHSSPLHTATQYLADPTKLLQAPTSDDAVIQHAEATFVAVFLISLREIPRPSLTAMKVKGYPVALEVIPLGVDRLGYGWRRSAGQSRLYLFRLGDGGRELAW